MAVSRSATLLAVLAVAAAAGCSPALPGPFPRASVVLVTIDTLRADRLGAYGYTAGRTPRLDALARESVVFDEVLAHYPLTLPAHASLFTGLLPPRHGVRSNSGFHLAPSHATLATRLKGAGWQTGGAVSSIVLSRQTGIAQGFDFYEDAIQGAAPEAFSSAQRSGAVTLDTLLRWIDGRRGDRVFAFLHLYEPHSPYAPPEAFRMADPYDGEVAAADALVGRLVDALRDAGRLDDTLLVVTADHGESLGEHGEEEHGVFLYRSTLRVPLLVRLPGALRGGTRVRGTVGQADVAATILDLLGQPADGLDGRSQRNAMTGRPPEARAVYSESLYPRYAFGWSELRALSDGRYRYVEAPRPELYDVAEDPAETRDVAADRRNVAAAMARALASLDAAGAPKPAPVSAEEAERLRALGYVSGGDAEGATPGAASLPDPKDRIGSYAVLKKAMTAFREGRWAEVEPLLGDLIAREPGLVSLHGMRAHALLRLEREDEALAALERGLSVDPARPGFHLAAARVWVRRGDLDRALVHANQAAGGKPGGGAQVLASLLLSQRSLDGAERFARAALRERRDALTAHFVLGAVQHERGRFADALVSFRAALAARPPGAVVPRLHANIGDCLARLGHADEAEAEFQAEIDANPAGPEAWLGLALLQRARGRPEEAQRTLEQWLLAVPQAGAEHHALLVRMFVHMGDEAAAVAWLRVAAEAFPTDPRFRAEPGSRAGRP